MARTVVGHIRLDEGTDVREKDRIVSFAAWRVRDDEGEFVGGEERRRDHEKVAGAVRVFPFVADEEVA